MLMILKISPFVSCLSDYNIVQMDRDISPHVFFFGGNPTNYLTELLTTILARCLLTVINVHFTVLSCVTCLTNAQVCIHSISTDSSIPAWTAATLIIVNFTQNSCIASETGARKSIHMISAHAAMVTRHTSTVVNISLTGFSHKTWQTVAAEVRNKILTGSPISTGVSMAIIYICLTNYSSESPGAMTTE